MFHPGEKTATVKMNESKANQSAVVVKARQKRRASMELDLPRFRGTLDESRGTNECLEVLQSESEVPEDLFVLERVRDCIGPACRRRYVRGPPEKMMEVFAHLETEIVFETFIHHWSRKLVRACWSLGGY